MTRKNIFIFVALIIFSSLNACAHPAFYRAAEIKGQVVDAETKEPIEGVAVVAQWILYGNGSHNKVLEVYEAITDSNGGYHMPSWGPKLRPGLYYLDSLDPQISFFKRGYKYAKLINSDPQKFYQRHKPEEVENWSFGKLRGRVFASGPGWEHNRSLRESVWDGRTVELKKFVGSNKELDRMLSRINIEVINNEEEGVPLKKIRYMVIEYAEAMNDLKAQPPIIYPYLSPNVEKFLKEELK